MFAKCMDSNNCMGLLTSSRLYNVIMLRKNTLDIIDDSNCHHTFKIDRFKIIKTPRLINR